MFRVNLFVIVSCIFQTAALSQNDTTFQLKEFQLVYQADRLSPATFQDVDAPTLIRKSTGQEPSFIFSELPSITAYSDAGNTQGYSYIRMRGIDQTRINITFDGVPLNEPEDQGAYFSNYPDLLNSVRKIQIQRGVGTSKNGVASYGGSIQLFSPPLQDSSRLRVGLGYGSFNSFRGFAEGVIPFSKKQVLYARASRVSADGYKYDAFNRSQSILLSHGIMQENASWKFNLLAGRQANGLAWLGVSDSLIDLDPRTNGNKNEEDQFTQCLAQVLNNRQLNPSSSLQTSIYYTYLDGNYDFDLFNFLGINPIEYQFYNYAFRSNLVGFFSNYSVTNRHFQWTTGVHGNLYARRHTGSERRLGILYRNTGYKNEASLFSKITYNWNSWQILADLQLRHTSFDYAGAIAFEQFNWNFFNPKIGMTYALDDRTVFYLSSGKTSREPTRNDLFGGNDELQKDNQGNTLIYNQTPETVYDQEAGVRYRSEKMNLSLNLFYMSFRNEIVLNGKFGPNGLALTNKVDRSYRSGIEMSCRYEINPHFYVSNHSAFNYSRIEEQGLAFSPILTPPLIVNQDITYVHKRFSTTLSARFQDESWMDFANSSNLDRYWLLNASIHYTGNNLSLALYWNNLTNQRYFNNGYVDFDGSKKYFIQSPSNVYAAIQYIF
ncbi:MAG: TonB-dependent receptor [Saprospiraceae bacterium]|nr:TonB-dependent receptor [Saprospiraceae bacterium]